MGNIILTNVGGTAAIRVMTHRLGIDPYKTAEALEQAGIHCQMNPTKYMVDCYLHPRAEAHTQLFAVIEVCDKLLAQAK